MYEIGQIIKLIKIQKRPYDKCNYLDCLVQ